MRRLLLVVLVLGAAVLAPTAAARVTASATVSG